MPKKPLAKLVTGEQSNKTETSLASFTTRISSSQSITTSTGTSSPAFTSAKILTFQSTAPIAIASTTKYISLKIAISTAVKISSSQTPPTETISTLTMSEITTTTKTPIMTETTPKTASTATATTVKTLGSKF